MTKVLICTHDDLPESIVIVGPTEAVVREELKKALAARGFDLAYDKDCKVTVLDALAQQQ